MAATPASPKNALGRKRMSNAEYAKIAYSKQAGKTLDEIREQIADCKKCPLWETRTNIVFGGPNPTARIMIVGEAPGKNDYHEMERVSKAFVKDLNKRPEIDKLFSAFPGLTPFCKAFSSST